MSSRTLLLRADASVSAGTGHVMRCLALAQAWQDAGGHAIFAMAEATPAIYERLAAERCQVEQISAAAGTGDDANQAIELARAHEADWIAVDGYSFDSDYQRALKAADFKILFLDDYGHAQHYLADVVLNQNLSAAASLYEKREPSTRLLLGPRYCLLRREFAAWRDWKREVKPLARRVLVMMGGSDPENLTARVLEALSHAAIEDLEATVVVGGSNPHFDELENMAHDSRLKITLRSNVATIGECMAEADVAISAAGSTVWELCLLGLPALLIDVAANQTALAGELARRECAIHLGDARVMSSTISDGLRNLSHEYEGRRMLSERSRELVDGRGADRVVSLLRGGLGLRLRQVRPEDRRLLWEWANDTDVRAASFSPEPILWETHVAWFEEKMHAAAEPRPTSIILIAEDDDGAAIGQIRFDARPDSGWDTDVTVAKAMRGRRLASELIRLGFETIAAQDSNKQVHAFVKPANIASIKAFERAGFRQRGTENLRGHMATHLVHES